MKKVLILDDEVVLLQIWEDYFRLWDLEAEVYTATSGVGGLVLLREHKFDLIITDYMMPGMDGLEFIRELRKDDKKTPVCFFTGHLPELMFLVEEMDRVLLFEKPMISEKMLMYIRLCLNDELKPVEAI